MYSRVRAYALSALVRRLLYNFVPGLIALVLGVTISFLLIVFLLLLLAMIYVQG